MSDTENNSEPTIDYVLVFYELLVQRRQLRVPALLLSIAIWVYTSYLSIKYCWFVAIPYLSEWGMGPDSTWWTVLAASFGMIYPALFGFVGMMVSSYPGMVVLSAINEKPLYITGRAQMKPQDKVFVVHGHDDAAKIATARFLEQIGVAPIILHEQVNKGNTIIEKFEENASNVKYAIVLLTPDDLGASTESPENQKNRARQNVILELGYFIGKLGRRNVSALVKGDLEIPTDYMGVVYTPMDQAEGWKLAVFKELKSAGIAVNSDALIG